MRSPRVSAGKVVSGFPPADERPMSNGCPQVEALDRQTAQISRLADELKLARETVSPAVDAITNLDQAQRKFCGFLVKHRVKLLLSAPLVLTAVGAISPAAAERLSAALRAWGLS